MIALALAIYFYGIRTDKLDLIIHWVLQKYHVLMNTVQYRSWLFDWLMFTHYASIILAYQNCLLCPKQCQHIVLVPTLLPHSTTQSKVWAINVSDFIQVKFPLFTCGWYLGQYIDRCITTMTVLFAKINISGSTVSCTDQCWWPVYNYNLLVHFWRASHTSLVSLLDQIEPVFFHAVFFK